MMLLSYCYGLRPNKHFCGFGASDDYDDDDDDVDEFSPDDEQNAQSQAQEAAQRVGRSNTNAPL